MTSDLVGCQRDNNQLLLLHKRSEALSHLDVTVRETAPKAKQDPALLQPQCQSMGTPYKMGTGCEGCVYWGGERTSHPCCRDRPKHYRKVSPSREQQELFLAVS